MSLSQQRLLEVFRCPGCRESLRRDEVAINGADALLTCVNCGETFPIIDGIPRLLLPPLRGALLGKTAATGTDARQIETALSFGFEWNQFPEMYAEWEQSFLDYMQPHGAEFFRGKRVLDAGCGNGRFAYYAAKFGAEVWAIDLGSAVDVARWNTEAAGNVQVLQADLHRPPFVLESFDFIYSIGVLHHLPDPEAAFQNLLRYLKPNGEIQIYLYWKPEDQPIKSAMLACLTAARQITTRLPHAIVYALAYPSAIAAYASLVWPHMIMKQIPGLSQLAEKLPMKQYARFPFRVCVNDQLDRFLAPIENRYSRREVFDWLGSAGLRDPQVNAVYGWVATGRKPVAGATTNAEAK